MCVYKTIFKLLMIGIFTLGYTLLSIGVANGTVNKTVNGTKEVIEGAKEVSEASAIKLDGGNKIVFEIPEFYGIFYGLFFIVIGFISAYYAYFFIKKFIKYVFYTTAIYVLSLVILNHFHIIDINSDTIKTYITSFLNILRLVYHILPYPNAFIIGVAFGLIFAFARDNKINILAIKKPASGGGGAKAPPKK